MSLPLGIQEISILEDSRYFVNRSVDALNLQMRRLESYKFSDSDDFWEYLADVHFYIVALKRLRQSMLVGKKVKKIQREIENAFGAFDDAISDALSMRHILEHIDEYIQNTGRNSEIKNSELYSVLPSEGGISWGGLQFDRNKTHEAAHVLVTRYREITSYEFKLYKEANQNRGNSS